MISTAARSRRVTPTSTTLSCPISEICREMLGQHSCAIQYAIEDLDPGKNGFRCLVTSKVKKQKAQEAYDLLDTDDAVYGLPKDLAREIQEKCFFPVQCFCG